MATAEELRRMREEQSIFSALYDFVNQQNAQLSAEGRRPVLGGLLSKEPVQGVDTIRYEGIGNMLAGLLAPAAKAVDAPMAAYQGNIPREDMISEALGTAGMAMLGGGAVPLPKGAIGANRLIGYDNPQGDWLQRKVKLAEENISEGGVGITGPTTAYTKESVMLPVDQLSSLKGAMGEKPAAGQVKYDDLMQSVQKEGFTNNSPILVGVNHRGEPYIVEGNNRVAVAKAMGIDRIPAEVRWYNGGEDVATNWSPQSVENMLAANASKSAGAIALPAARNEAEAMARQILEMRAAGRAGDVTDAMMAQADPQYMFNNTPLPMDEASRMARAAEMGLLDDAYHATGAEFQQFIPSEFRGASFFGSTPEGASRGASASANEGVGSGSNITMPVRVNTSGVEGLGAYARKDMNEFRAALPDRVYTEAEVDALMASDAAPLRGNWNDFFDDMTNYDALRVFREQNPDAPIPEGIIAFRPKQPLRYGPSLRADLSGKQFAHYSDGMSERPTSEYVKSQGNTGFTMLDESGLALAMTDPTTIRSRFARFDPEFSHLANLTAANASPIGGLLAQSGVSSEQAQRIEDYLYKTGLLQ